MILRRLSVERRCVAWFSTLCDECPGLLRLLGLLVHPQSSSDEQILVGGHGLPQGRQHQLGQLVQGRPGPAEHGVHVLRIHVQ